MRVTIQNNYHMALNHLIVIYVNLTKLFSLQEKSKKFQLNMHILLAIRELAHNMLYNVYYKSQYDLIKFNLNPSLALLRVETSFGGHADEGRRVSRGHLSLRLSGGIILGDGCAPPFHQGIASGGANRDQMLWSFPGQREAGQV